MLGLGGENATGAGGGRWGVWGGDVTGAGGLLLGRGEFIGEGLGCI